MFCSFFEMLMHSICNLDSSEIRIASCSDRPFMPTNAVKNAYLLVLDQLLGYNHQHLYKKTNYFSITTR